MNQRTAKLIRKSTRNKSLARPLKSAWNMLTKQERRERRVRLLKDLWRHYRYLRQRQEVARRLRRSIARSKATTSRRKATSG